MSKGSWRYDDEKWENRHSAGAEEWDEEEEDEECERCGWSEVNCICAPYSDPFVEDAHLDGWYEDRYEILDY